MIINFNKVLKIREKTLDQKFKKPILQIHNYIFCMFFIAIIIKEKRSL